MQDRCCKINRNIILREFHPLCVEKFAFARPQQWCCGIIILSSLILLRVGDNSITRYQGQLGGDQTGERDGGPGVQLQQAHLRGGQLHGTQVGP